MDFIKRARDAGRSVYGELKRVRRGLPKPPPFPSLEGADPSGPIAMGGALSPALLLTAYRQGFFPRPERGTIGWLSPDPRAVIDPAQLHVPKRLRQVIRQGRFEVTFDRACEETLRACARPDTWLSEPLIAALLTLHQQGVVHSVEAWREGSLVGGAYGVSLGAVFAAESMFHREDNAGRVALVALFERLAGLGYGLIDLQTQSCPPALTLFKPQSLSRREFCARLEALVDQPTRAWTS